MDTSKLPKSYFVKQIQRVVASRDRIANRSAVVSDGRKIPDDGALPIGIGRRINASVMFLDISGFSGRKSETTQEQDTLLRVLTFFFAEMIRIVEDYDGFVEKNTGDGLMAYFAADSSGITEQQRALAAALTMICAAETLLNPVIMTSDVAKLDFRICIEHGTLTIAEVGAARRFHGVVAIGTTANVASKMLSCADPNTIVLGERQLRGLPVDWQNRYARLKTYETGWVYTNTGAPYPFYEYTGRWIIPTP